MRLQVNKTNDSENNSAWVWLAYTNDGRLADHSTNHNEKPFPNLQDCLDDGRSKYPDSEIEGIGEDERESWS